MTIDTTAEHPFFEESLGWIEARSLTPGHRLRTLDGSAIAVESLAETGQWQPVYNLRVADWHTYFVGDDEWGFSVWAHNAECSINQVRRAITASGGEAYAINQKTAAAIRDFIKAGTDEGWEAAKSLLSKTGANVDDLSWALVRKYGRLDAVKRVALSTDLPLDTFARQIGGESWKQFAKGDPLHWKDAFLDLLYGSDAHFVFNLKGLQVTKGIERASMGRGGATDWELFQLYQAKEHHHRITWLLDGKVQPPPSLFG
ncbi:yd repeat-containing protein : YD repeat protein OS=Isosphaera pallida (strain ATCC 43644 / DSM 9630 / IS1B) GN=Isop_2419 PE=4 SV=1: PT-HINT [Tuwongella immobilis]|uniref:Intein C-terminal splicing domain-containing protein n=1 Tax=Tuwongella immobilis TaxID=692036 RepID=A0A6C2YKK4_9BACT|nr:yd repeat-containing protein : YD repeat protein OS=Isosphaera pallida (strain ATCC 43644 / DSM 9630 / IS1B) GN=Isop_2419 PE=4 SV=1: PT-HINT [Tuwongella immobilis]VTR99017.1 yd repeat-containing protein : YD repeat protein OS=Isosphaera pallida (strain ATCC 43644 / DSM 9630 / IS1B) GN=Isop_2419 PE=4 SV=1: PT-HINT [Tuwongella immobilis]